MLLERLTELYHRVHKLDRLPIHGLAIIQSSRSDNERKCKYFIESEKCKRAAFTLPTCTGKGAEI